MGHRKYYLLVMLAMLCPAISTAQTIPNAVGAAQGAVGAAQGAAAGQSAAVSSMSNKIQAAKASLGSQAPVAGQHGPFGIGQPRTFPIVRHLKQQHATCKAKIRSSPLGKLFDGPRKMLSKATGGMVPAQPTPNHVELAAPGPQGASAKIKKDKLESPKRLAAIQHLATVDCHWYPEALTQLTVALRTDRSECVRFEAAKILTGCGCCTPALIQALRVCVAGTNIDGNPSERSLRIRDQAALALENCLACSSHDEFSTPGLPTRPEYPVAPAYSAENDTDSAGLPSKQIAQSQSSSMTNGKNQIARASYVDDVKEKRISKKASNVEMVKSETEKAKLVLQSFRESKPKKEALAAPLSLKEIWKRSQK
ncbi:MAG: hypothetical protein AB8B55_13315 [Mariniblastus sp.]